MENNTILTDPNPHNRKEIELSKDRSGNFVIRATVDTNENALEVCKSYFNSLDVTSIKFTMTKEGDEIDSCITNK